jgi:hypothetical protein
MLWRTLALAFLLCAGCADWQVTKQSPRLPNPDFLLENSESFFADPDHLANPPSPPRK